MGSRSSPPSVFLPVPGAVLGSLASVSQLRFGAFGVIGLLVSGWLFVSGAHAAQVQSQGRIEKVDVIDHGTYEPMKGKVPKGVPPYGPDDVQLVGVTNFIPAQLGINFGFRYRIVGNRIGAP